MGMVWPRACLGGQGGPRRRTCPSPVACARGYGAGGLGLRPEQSRVSPDAYRRHLKTGARLAVRSTMFVRHKLAIFAKYLETHLLTQRRQPIGNYCRGILADTLFG